MSTVKPLNVLSEQELLESAFEEFNRSSLQLQKKYEVLAGESRALREQLARKDEQIQKQAKLATLGQMAAALAHEIRNPLGAMQLFSSLLREDLQESPESLKHLGHIEKAIHNLNPVVSNVLQFSKQPKQDFSPVNLHAVLQELSYECSQTHPEVSIALSLQGSPFVFGDSHGLRQVFLNLFMNAIQAMKGQGRIDLDCRCSAPGKVHVEIVDSGPGIAEEILPGIFEPFATNRNEGTGLGLTIVKQILDAHQATIEASNIEGKGARFTIEFQLKR